MCIVSFRIAPKTKYPFVFVGNRDEFYNRPSQSIHAWSDYPNVYGGRDLEKGGTWLAITKEGKFATLLNYPYHPEKLPENPESRGKLLTNFLTSKTERTNYIHDLKASRNLYEGYHFIFGNINHLDLYSNVLNRHESLENGSFTFSNTHDDLSNFRVHMGHQRLNDYLDNHSEVDCDDLIDLFHNTKKHPNFKTYPKQFEYERAYNASSLFIKDPVFGTVGTTVILVDSNGHVTIKERRYSPTSIIETNQLNFKLYGKELIQ